MDDVDSDDLTGKRRADHSRYMEHMSEYHVIQCEFDEFLAPTGTCCQKSAIVELVCIEVENQKDKWIDRFRRCCETSSSSSSSDRKSNIN